MCRLIGRLLIGIFTFNLGHVCLLARIEDKIRVFQATMRRMRLEEEKTILVKEMAQHCSWLQKLMTSLQIVISEEGKY